MIKEKIIYLDVETTGFSSSTNGMTEIGAIYVEDGEIKSEINLFINPYTYKKKVIVENKAISFRGVTEADLIGYDDSKVSFNKFIKWLDSKCNKFDRNDKLIFAGYNSDTFDIKFMIDWFVDNGHKYFGSYFGNETIDVFKLVKQNKIKKEFNLKNDKLSTIAEHYKIELNAHIAMDDIIATYKIHQILSNRFDHDKMNDLYNKTILSKTEHKYYDLHLDEMKEWVTNEYNKWVE